MTTFSELLRYAESSRDVLRLIEDSANSRILSLFSRYEGGLIQYGELRREALQQARAAFITSGSVGIEHMREVSRASRTGDTVMVPGDEFPVMTSIMRDIARNMETFRDSERTEKDLRRLRFRVRLSVQTAARRGFSEHKLAFAQKLSEKGAVFRKVWLANFSGNTPCGSCARLHGQVVDLDEEFDKGGPHDPKCYHGLYSPARHPNCRCYMLIFPMTLDAVVNNPETPQTQEQFMTSKEVRRLPRAVFKAVVATLRLIAGKLKEAVRGVR